MFDMNQDSREETFWNEKREIRDVKRRWVEGEVLSRNDGVRKEGDRFTERCEEETRH